MDVLIVGSGVIGSLYGWALTEAGHNVVHLVRAGRSAGYAQGMPLDVLDERKGHTINNSTTYKIRTVESLPDSRRFGLVILPLSQFKLEFALRDLTPAMPDADFLVFGSNWDGVDLIERFLPPDRYLLGYADGGGTFRNGLLWGNLGAEVHVGTPEGGSDTLLRGVVDLFQTADMKPDVQANMLHWLWVHNVSAVPLWLGFGTHRDVKTFLRDTPLLRRCFRASKECLALCERRGVRVAAYPDVSYFRYPEWLLLLVFRWLWTHNKSMQRYTAHAALELDEPLQYYDAFMATARGLALDVPYMAGLADCVAEIRRLTAARA